MLNVNKKILPDWQVFSPLILAKPPSKLRKWRRRKRIVVFQNTGSRFSRTNTVFHFSSIRCKQMNRWVNYRRRSTTKIKVFASGGRAEFSQNSPPKNKCRFAISREHYIGIIQIFENLRIIFESVRVREVQLCWSSAWLISGKWAKESFRRLHYCLSAILVYRRGPPT